MTSWQTELDRAIERVTPQMIEVRRHLHQSPEPSGAEHETSLYLYQMLSDQNLSVEMGPEGRGVTAQPLTAPDIGLLGLRADIDALRIHDQKQVAYRSRNDGLMHACGHDAHSATLLGCCLALAAMETAGTLPWPVPWRAIFQPAEETATGASEMIAAGAIEGVTAILAAHMDPSRAVGKIGLRTGVLTANCDSVRLTIAGRGGHAARPHESNDPIAAAAQLISTLYLFLPRATDSQDAVVLTIGQLIGGDNPNVIPESVELRGTLRTLDPRVRERTLEHIRQLARGIAEASSTQIELVVDASMGSVRNDTPLTHLLQAAATEVVGAKGVERIARPSMGSEDFAAYLHHVPGAMFRLGCASAQTGSSALHSPTFDIDEAALALGARIFARAAIQWSVPPDRQSTDIQRDRGAHI